MGEMKKIHIMILDGSYPYFMRAYHNALSDEKKEFTFKKKKYTTEKAEAIALFVKDTLKKL